MKQLVIMPGGFHPFHAGHLSLYQYAQQAFPGADVKVAATNDTSTRPFPFKLKEKLAQLAGVPPGDFYQVKSPFQAQEITQNYDPADTQLIFIRSDKDANQPPIPGRTKKDGTPGYLQPITDQMAPMTQHAYMAYGPTEEFGPGMKHASQIRTAWPDLTERQRTALVMSLYPNTQKNPKLANTVVKMLDTAMGTENLNEFARGDFNGGDDSNDLQLYLNVAKKLNMKKYKPSTAHNLIAKKMAELVDVVDDDKVDYARHMARKAQGLPSMLDQQGVAEGVPQPGKSSGKPISWIDPTKVVTEYLTLDEIFKSVSDIPYYNNVVDDRDKKDFTWGVTKRVIQYAKELVIRPDAYKNWPPIIVLDGKLQDGAHRISTIYLMQQRVQPNNPIWKNAKLKVEFGTSDNVEQGVAEEVTRQMNIGGMRASYQSKYNQPIAEDYLDEARS